MTCVILRPLKKIGREKNANMGQQLSIKSDRILNRILDEAQDPETGLALLSKCPHPSQQTPEQNLECSFWQDQFTHWRNWRAGDLTAVYYALCSCALSRRPPPTWLCKAAGKLCEQCLSDDEKRAYGDLKKHIRRWEAVECVRGQYPGDPRNYKMGVHGDDVWPEAAKLVVGTDAEALADTVRKSHALIRRAGGHNVTLQSYKREVARNGRAAE